MGYYDVNEKEWIVDGKTDGGQPYDCVTGILFSTLSGKFKYMARLDYSDIWYRLVSGPEREAAQKVGLNTEYLNPNDGAVLALGNAYRKHKHGEYKLNGYGAELDFFPSVLEGYTLIVPDPPNGYPLMIKGVRNYELYI